MKRILGLIIIFLILIWAAICFSSCTVIRDNKAVNRVTASRILLYRVKAPVDSLWPCIIDTVTKFKPGRVDSVPYEVLIPLFIDTTDRNRIADSLQNTEGICWELNKQAYNNGFKAARKLIEGFKVPLPVRDTIETFNVDHRGLDIANSARLSAEHEVANLQGTITGIQSTADDYKSERNKWMWAFIGLLVLAASVSVLTLYLKFKPKLPI